MLTNKNKKEIIGFVVCAGSIFFILFFVYGQHKDPRLPHAERRQFIQSLVGTWTRVGATNFDTSAITISEPTSTDFIFNVSSTNGANSGEWSNYNDEAKKYRGRFKIDDKVAFYTDPEGCSADFVLSQDGTTLDLDTDCDESNAGIGVHFDGAFRRDVVSKTITIEHSALFAKNPTLYQSFVKLVDTYLPLFDSTVQNESANAEYSSFSVSHALTEMESIVVQGPKSKLWAAVIDWDADSKESVVRYFTNDAQSAKRMPGIIHEWMSAFGDYRIVYMSSF